MEELLLAGVIGGRGSAWTPAKLTAVTPWIVPALSLQQGKVWQDTGKTTPAAADGDPVRVITCPFTNQDFTAPTNAKRPLLRVSGRYVSLQFDGVDDQLDPPAAASITGDTTLCFRVAESAPQAFIRVLESRTINALLDLRRNDGNGFYVNGTVAGGAGLVADSNPHTAVIGKPSGGNWSLWIDGSAVTCVANTTDWGSYGWGLGGTGGLTETFTGNLYGGGGAASVQSTADRQQLEAYLASLSP